MWTNTSSALTSPTRLSLASLETFRCNHGTSFLAWDKALFPPRSFCLLYPMITWLFEKSYLYLKQLTQKAVWFEPLQLEIYLNLQILLELSLLIYQKENTSRKLTRVMAITKSPGYDHLPTDKVLRSDILSLLCSVSFLPSCVAMSWRLLCPDVPLNSMHDLY